MKFVSGSQRCATASSLALRIPNSNIQGQVDFEAARVPQARLYLGSDSPEATSPTHGSAES